jgi:UPF0716 protein FxsA
MGIIGRLALLFIVVPVAELVILVRLGQVIGLWPTLAIVLATGLAGATLARLEGMRVAFAFRQELASGRIPSQPMLDGISVLIGAAFLLTPGILTDVAGLMLLFPPTRRWLQRRIRSRLERAVAEGTVHVVTMGPGGFGGWGSGPGGFPQGVDRRPGADFDSGPGPGLDPRKGIVIEPDDD